MTMKRCELTYWLGESEEGRSEDGHFETIDVLVSQRAIKSLMSNKPPSFIEVIINDGERMVIPTDNINRLVQTFK